MVDRNYEIRDVTEDDIRYVSSRMRERDRLEVWATLEMEPEQGIRESIAKSDFAKTLVIGSTPVGIYGVSTVTASLSGRRWGAPWMLTTEDVPKCRRAYLQATKEILPSLLKNHDVLLNYVDDRYEAAIRWLKSLGFWVGPAIRYGLHGEMFRPFAIDRED